MMKFSIKTLSLLLFIFILTPAFSQLKKDTFKVEGKCDMCKIRIEKAATSVKGVQTANWNIETKILAITFDPLNSSSFRVEQAVAKVGHATKYAIPTKVAYFDLPSCCQYQSKETKSSCHHNI